MHAQYIIALLNLGDVHMLKEFFSSLETAGVGSSYTLAIIWYLTNQMSWRQSKMVQLYGPNRWPIALARD
jgi:hypothetical protein